MPLDEKDKISILLEEYKALYSLLVYRFSSIEKRVTVSGAIISTLLAFFPKFPPESKMIFLVGVPIALMYILKSSLLHVRSLEDYFRKIERVEKAVNDLSGEALLRFQSDHPSRTLPGGRGTQELLGFILIMSLGILLACTYLSDSVYEKGSSQLYYWAYAMSIAIYLISTRTIFRNYQYAPSRTFEADGSAKLPDDISDEKTSQSES